MKKNLSSITSVCSLLLAGMVSKAAALEAYPLAAITKETRARLATVKVDDTGLTRTDYLVVIEGIVSHFRHFQQADGRIIDPFEKREIQNSTPSFAWAASVLVGSGHNPELLENAAIALDVSLEQLAAGGHGNFHTLPVMLAFEQLRDRVAPEQRKRWEQLLGRIDQERAYGEAAVGEGPAARHAGIAAMAGEFLRSQNDFANLEFVERHLETHLGHFTAEGLYRDSNGAMAYDHLARFFLTVMLHRGYSGAQSAELAEWLERGAWTSLLMQSSAGELPTGGRSAQHQWNEAQQCATFEIWAARMQQQEDPVAARAFKRAAHLSLQSVLRWVRPSGDLSIVKNRFDPAARHGYDSESFHAQDNLLAASLLATAWHFADANIPEGAAPADAGGFAFQVPAFGKIFANAGGLYIQIETAGDPRFDSTGLVRVHRTGVDPLVGPTASSAAQHGALAIGLGWREPEAWNALASQTQETIRNVRMTVHRATPQRVQFAVRYELGLDVPEEGRDPAEPGSTPVVPMVRTITETYEVVPAQVRVIVDVAESDARVFSVRFPALVFDGRRIGRISVEGAGAAVQIGNSRNIFVIEQPGITRMRRSGYWIRSRNGFLEMLEGQTSARRIVYRIRPEHWSETR